MPVPHDAKANDAASELFPVLNQLELPPLQHHVPCSDVPSAASLLRPFLLCRPPLCLEASARQAVGARDKPDFSLQTPELLFPLLPVISPNP